MPVVQQRRAEFEAPLRFDADGRVDGTSVVLRRCRGVADRLAALLVVLCLSVGAAGCGGAAPRDPTKTVAPHRSAENVGTGALRGTRFAVPPVVTVTVDPNNPSIAGYTVYVRLNRDLQRRRSGLIAAEFGVDDARSEDPVGRASRRHPNCFQAGVAIPPFSNAPATAGAKVRVGIFSLDGHNSPSGHLTMTVKLKLAERRAANDYSRDPNLAVIGC